MTDEGILASFQEFEKHEQLLGKVAVQWTRMHEIMAMVFGHLVSPDDLRRGHTAWHVTVTNWRYRHSSPKGG